MKNRILAILAALALLCGLGVIYAQQSSAYAPSWTKYYRCNPSVAGARPMEVSYGLLWATGPRYVTLDQAKWRPVAGTTGKIYSPKKLVAVMGGSTSSGSSTFPNSVGWVNMTDVSKPYGALLKSYLIVDNYTLCGVGDIRLG